MVLLCMRSNDDFKRTTGGRLGVLQALGRAGSIVRAAHTLEPPIPSRATAWPLSPSTPQPFPESLACVLSAMPACVPVVADSDERFVSRVCDRVAVVCATCRPSSPPVRLGPSRAEGDSTGWMRAGLEAQLTSSLLSWSSVWYSAAACAVRLRPARATSMSYPRLREHGCVVPRLGSMTVYHSPQTELSIGDSRASERVMTSDESSSERACAFKSICSRSQRMSTRLVPSSVGSVPHATELS